MRFLFPYSRIEKNSLIVLYGCGTVGQQFYWQLCKSSYCHIVGWTDQIIDRKAAEEGRLKSVEQIVRIKFDYIVIAVADENIAEEIKDRLIGLGVLSDKIVWEDYELRSMVWPDNQDVFLHHGDFLLRAMELFTRSRQQFGYDQFYQSFPKLGLRGQRPTQERIESYGLRDVLKKHMDVLDIGCNCGFFDLQIADMVQSVTGLEINHDLICLALETRDYFNIENCKFFEEDFKQWRAKRTYDMVFAFAILCWIGLKPQETANRLLELVASEGYILMESHNLQSKNRLEDFEQCVKVLSDHGMQIVKEGTICDDGSIQRKFVLLRS